MIERARVNEDSTKVRRPGPRGRAGADELPCLEVVEGGATGTRFWLIGRKAVIGRSPKADFTIDDDGISREHAKLVRDDDGLVNVVDLGSTNGTFLNEAPIDAAIVRGGDRIRLGADVVMRFAYLTRGTPEPQRPPPDGRTVELSTREAEIARLVADGLTNAEIAQRLNISPHTVMTHLSNVFAREGIASRAELASLVAGGRVRALPRGGKR